MVSISGALSVGKTQAYYSAEYSANTNTHYFSQNETLHGEWQGKLSEVFGLSGQQVKNEHFQRLAAGKDPNTGEVLVKSRNTSQTRSGEVAEKRSAFDLCFSAPKSVSLAALVGGDSRIIDAHRTAIRVALQEAESIIQAQKHMGNRSMPETTQKALFAVFDHDTARPVNGYAAAQLHTHCVLLNMTEGKNGQARSLEPKEIFRAAGLLTATYQNHLEIELRKFGYQIEVGKNHAPEIVGFTPEYLASESKRSKQIDERAEELGLTGQAAKSNIAHQTREAKLKQGPEEVRAAHIQNAAKFGNQPQKIVAEAAARQSQYREEPRIAKSAVDFARSKLSERNAVFDHHQVLAEALWFARGRVGLAPIKAEIDRQKADGQFIAVQHVRPFAPGWRYTTPALIEDERSVIEKVRFSPEREPINRMTDESLAARVPKLNEHQRKVVLQVLGSERQISGWNGSAGVGKSFSLGIVCELVEEKGFKPVGLAPTSGAVRALKEMGVKDSDTLQRFLLMPNDLSARNRLFMVDEGSLTSSRQMRKFLDRIHETDRVLVVGDFRQHQSVDAGRIFEELQLAGMQTARLNKLVRQQDPGLKEVVKAMAQGRIADGVKLLDDQDRITEVEHRGKRFEAIAKAYATDPEGTLVVSPDNNSRSEINGAIRREMKEQGKIGEDVAKVKILVPRQDITGADRAVAGAYQIGDVVLFRNGSKKIGIKSKEYAAVIGVDRDANEIKVKTTDGRVFKYNPERLKGVSLYTPEIRQFAEGDRLQFTSPDRKIGIANRDVGTVIHIERAGNVRLKMDDGRVKSFNLHDHRHVEHGFTSTSHAAQGSTVNRVLVNIDTGDSRVRALVTQTFAYVALSRPKFEAQVFTDSKANLAQALSRRQENAMALAPGEIKRYKGMAA